MNPSGREIQSQPIPTDVTAKPIHADTYLGRNPQGQIIFDIDAATPNPTAVIFGTLSVRPLTSGHG